MSLNAAFNSSIHCIVDVIKAFKPGISFVPSCATDLDDPSTPDAELQKILTQTPSQPSEHMFQRDSRTWAISLSAEGKTELDNSSVLDTSQVSNYHLIVQVKDSEDQYLGYHALATAEIAVVESTWVAPARNIHATLELDRESQAELYQHEMQVLAGNNDRLLYGQPLTLLITVMDESDSLPVQEFYQVALKENTAKCENSSYAELNYETVQGYTLIISPRNKEELVKKSWI
ncbi:LOW QUALITY PROTEIN: cadherin-16 [Porphyrio hochstetteri]